MPAAGRCAFRRTAPSARESWLNGAKSWQCTPAWTSFCTPSVTAGNREGRALEGNCGCGLVAHTSFRRSRNSRIQLDAGSPLDWASNADISRTRSHSSAANSRWTYYVGIRNLRGFWRAVRGVGYKPTPTKARLPPETEGVPDLSFFICHLPSSPARQHPTPAKMRNGN